MRERYLQVVHGQLPEYDRWLTYVDG